MWVHMHNQRNGGGGDERGLEPPTLKEEGAEPPSFFKCVYALQNPQNCCQKALETFSKSQNVHIFSRGTCPQTLPMWLLPFVIEAQAPSISVKHSPPLDMYAVHTPVDPLKCLPSPGSRLFITQPQTPIRMPLKAPSLPGSAPVIQFCNMQSKNTTYRLVNLL